MVCSANMSLLTRLSQSQQSSVCNKMGENEEMQRDTSILCTIEYNAMYLQSSSTPSTVGSVSREQVDSDLASANMAMTWVHIMGYLGEEQKCKRYTPRGYA
jgi:hypothetical protein